MTSDQYKGKRITITFPTELYEKVEASAKEDNRSFSQQAVWLITQAYKLMDSKES
ncbi:MAG: hypothetical protein ICV78_10470 [Tolypothrix sp. Co-bin9]|nr:hypothetical protein [Tolypothrix sp. Co-bin9]